MVSLIETIVVFAVIPLAIYGIVSAFTLRPKATAGPRYRPGQQWGFSPLWWVANPNGVNRSHRNAEINAPRGQEQSIAKGGASGRW